MPKNFSSVVFSEAFLRNRIAESLGEQAAGNIKSANVVGVAEGMELIPTADVGTYTTQAGKTAMYLVTKDLVPSRNSGGGLFAKIGPADEPVDTDRLKDIADDMQGRVDDLLTVICALEEAQEK